MTGSRPGKEESDLASQLDLIRASLQPQVTPREIQTGSGKKLNPAAALSQTKSAPVLLPETMLKDFHAKSSEKAVPLASSVVLTQPANITFIEDYTPDKPAAASESTTNRRSQSMDVAVTAELGPSRRKDSSPPELASSTQIILAQFLQKPTITPPPPLNRSLSSLHIPDAILAQLKSGKLKSFEAKKRACNLSILEHTPKDFNNFAPDSYVLIKDKNKNWELIYLDEKKTPANIPIDKIPVIQTAYLAAEKAAASVQRQPFNPNILDEQNFEIERAIYTYRKDVQQKEVPEDIDKTVWVKAGNPKIIYAEAFNANIFNLLDNRSPRAFVYTEKNSDLILLGTDDFQYNPLRKDPLKDADLKVESFEAYSPFEAFEANEKSYPDADLKEDAKETFDVTLTENPLTVKKVFCKEFKKYLTLKRLATAITGSYALDENDLTPNNLGRNGRIDFDLLLHRVTCNYKDSKYYGIDGIYRRPNQGDYQKSRADIQSLPIIKNPGPNYFPGNPAPTLSGLFAQNGNAYKPEENAILAKLQNHPVFIYHKYKTLLKFLLTNEEMYRTIADSHIPKSHKHIGDELISNVMKNYREIYEELKLDAMFDLFRTDHGGLAFVQIKEEFAENKSQKIKQELVETKYEELKQEMNNSKLERDKIAKTTATNVISASKKAIPKYPQNSGSSTSLRP